VYNSDIETYIYIMLNKDEGSAGLSGGACSDNGVYPNNSNNPS